MDDKCVDNKLYVQLLNTMPGVCWIIDLQPEPFLAKYIYLSNKCEELYGVTKAELYEDYNNIFKHHIEDNKKLFEENPYLKFYSGSDLA